MKKCSRCNIEKSLTEYSKHSGSRDGFQSRCKQCKNDLQKQRYKNNPDYKSSVLEWKKNNKPQCYAAGRKWQFKNGSGIYGIFSNDLCLYIGESIRLNFRVSQHKTFIKSPNTAKQKYLYEQINQHNNVIIHIIEKCSPEVLIEREKYYIDTLKPLYNAS